MLIVAVSATLASGWEIFRSFRRARVIQLP